VRHLFALLLFKLLQVFESNGNYLDDELFLDYSFPYLKRISERVRERLVEANVTPVPMVRYLSPLPCDYPVRLQATAVRSFVSRAEWIF